jgi:hypothetical protein
MHSLYLVSVKKTMRLIKEMISIIFNCDVTFYVDISGKTVRLYQGKSQEDDDVNMTHNQREEEEEISDDEPEEATDEEEVSEEEEESEEASPTTNGYPEGWFDYDVDQEDVGDLLLTLEAKTIFVGACDCERDPVERYKRCVHKAWHDTNSLLLQMDDLSYVYIGGHMVYQFTTPNNEEIVSFISPFGNNGVPYPYAMTSQHLFFLNECKYALIENVTGQDEPYFPYEWYCADDERSENLPDLEVTYLLDP